MNDKIQEIIETMQACKDDPLATHYWSGYKTALLEMDSECRDRVIEAVREDLKRRSEVGLKKYGVSLERKDLTLDQWLEHAYEETLDLANYLKRSMMELRGEPLGLEHQHVKEACPRCGFPRCAICHAEYPTIGVMDFNCACGDPDPRLKKKPEVTIYVEADSTRVMSTVPITVHKVIGGVLVVTEEVEGNETQRSD